MKKGLVVVLAVFTSVAMIAGCSDSTPPDSLSLQAVKTYADQTKPQGIEIVDMKRDNGWVDTSAPNQYIVRYTYNYRLPKSYGDALLEIAKGAEKELAGAEKKGLAGGMEAMGMIMQANMWMQANEAELKPQVKKLLKSCAECDDYISDKHGPAARDRGIAFLIALYQLTEAGFNVDSKTGDKAPRWAQWTFIKTEKGWQAAQ